MGTGINLPPPPPLQFVQTGDGKTDATNQRIAYQWSDWFFRLQALAQAAGWTITVTAPSDFNVAGSPVGAGGTLGLSWVPQSAHYVMAGPVAGDPPGSTGWPLGIPGNLSSSGASTTATPGFRLLIADDYPTMVGDSGSGGTKGAVPTPSAGDAALAKSLYADGTWKTASVANPWPVIKETVDIGETCTIPSGFQLLVDENFDVSGTLIVDGELHVLDAGPIDSYWPTIKNKVDTLDAFNVESGFQMIVMEEFSIIGDLNLDGDLFIQL